MKATMRMRPRQRLRAMGRYTEAEPLLVRGFELVADATGEFANHPGRAAANLARFYEETGQPEKAGEWRSRSGQ